MEKHVLTNILKHNEALLPATLRAAADYLPVYLALRKQVPKGRSSSPKARNQVVPKRTETSHTGKKGATGCRGVITGNCKFGKDPCSYLQILPVWKLQRWQEQVHSHQPASYGRSFKGADSRSEGTTEGKGEG